MTTARAIFDVEILPLFQASQPRWLERARITARYLARKNGQVCADDVRAECPPPAGADPRIMGGIFRKTEYEKIGYVNSARVINHGRPVAIFKLRDQTGGLA